MQTIINSATSTFATTTGFTLASLVDFMTDLLTLTIGTGLGVLEQLWPVILAIIAIGAVVGLIWRAISFFRH